MLKITIDNEEVLSNKNFTIEEEMLNTPSVVLDNVYPKSWENDKDYTSRFYHPNDYSKCLIKDEIYTPAESGLNVEGTNFQVTADTTKLNELTSMKGNTTQSSTPTPTSPQPINVVSGRQDIVVCGKNLLPQDKYIATTTKNGITLTNNGDGTFNLSGTASANTTIQIIPIGNINLEANQPYYLYSSQAYNGTTFNMSIPMTDNGSTKFLLANNTYTPTSTPTNVRMQFYIASGQSVNATNVKLMLVKGSTTTSYEAYKGNTYEINLGKNLLPYPYVDSSKTLYGITYTVNQDGSITCNGTATNNSTFTLCNQNTSGIRQLLLNDDYYLSGCASGGNSSTYRLQLYGWNASGGGSLVDYGNGVSLSTFVNETKNFNISIFIANGTTVNDLTFYPMIEKGSTVSSYAPYKTPIELCKIGNYQDRIYKNGNKWYVKKEIGKVVLNGSEYWWFNTSSGEPGVGFAATAISTKNSESFGDGLCNYFQNNKEGKAMNSIRFGANDKALYFYIDNTVFTTLEIWKTWVRTHNLEIYYVLATPTTTEITDSELISQLESIELLEGLNNVSVVSPYLQGIINLHYNFVNEETTSNLLFCGVVKNSGNISLNPRYPHYQSLQILDFKTFLSEGETLDFVIANKTIEEAIDQIISTIAPYGFVKGNIQIIGADNVIGAYSTKDKTAYDVFNYLADITQSRWTTRLIDENTVAVDFYDPTLLPQGTPINYNETWFRDNLIDDMTYSYGSNDYRNKQVMTSNEVYGSILQTQTMVSNGYQTQFDTELKIGQITSITANGTQLTIATNEQKELGFNADIYYTPGNNYFESADLRSTGEILIVNYIAIVEGRQIITNGTEINRVATATGRKGIVARYENRNDANTSNELQLIGQSYIRYKGTPEIKLTIVSRKNLWNIGDRVQFNAPINELATEYMVKKKTINRILANPSSEEHIVYTYEMTSSFNSEQAINYFDNQRAKAKGNIGESEYITRNVDIENIANIIFYGSNVEQATIIGDNTLQATLNSPIIN